MASAGMLAAFLSIDPSFLARIAAAVPGLGKAASRPAATAGVSGPGGPGLPAVMAVPPREMEAAYARQYAIGPDARFVASFGILARRWPDYAGGERGRGKFAAGGAVVSGDLVRIPLLMDGRVVMEAVLPSRATFAQILERLDAWAGTMEAAVGPLPPAPGSGREEERYGNAVRAVESVDPRSIASGLDILDGLWAGGWREPKVVRTAARGYALLLMALSPDEMQAADPLAAEGLALLAIARRDGAGPSLAREEALLATAMEYRAHAVSLRAAGALPARDVREEILDAYIGRDAEALRRLRDREGGVLGHYLLARLLREADRDDEAREASRLLLDKFPSTFPSAVEGILSGSMGHAHRLTVLHPARLRRHVGHGGPWLAMLLRMPPGFILAVDSSFGGVVAPLRSFEGALASWQPYGASDPPRFFIDPDRLKEIFRSLYTDAVKLRFDFLYSRWAALEKAGTFADSLLAKDRDHPMVLAMAGRVAASRGRRDDAEAMFLRAFGRAAGGRDLIWQAFHEIDDERMRIRALPGAVRALDGRPANLLVAGWLLTAAQNSDLGALYYEAGIAGDPFTIWPYKSLCFARGSDAPLLEALDRYPESHKLLSAAGEHFSKRKDRLSLERAERCFAAAQALAPDVSEIPLDRASVLGKLGRYDEALAVLDDWEAGHELTSLSWGFFRSRRARIYLAMKRPDKALAAVENSAKTWQAATMVATARVHEALGNRENAADMFREAVERYPATGWVLAETAGFRWRCKEYGAAAQAIARGRRTQSDRDDWYAEMFQESFREAPDEEVLLAAAALGKSGAKARELHSLCRGLHAAGRSEVAFEIASGVKEPNRMLSLEDTVYAFEILRDWKGKEAAMEFLRERVPPGESAFLSIVLYKMGCFDVLLETAADPGSFKEPHREYMWLQKLLAWLALDRKPAGLEAEFMAHYGEGPGGFYRDAGRFLLGMATREELLGRIRTDKERCEAAYYIGLSERVAGNLPEALRWYQICKETLQTNNGEAHWAYSELLRWNDLGTSGRHRLPAEDIEEIRERRSAPPAA